ncbi:hypothetical protein DAI22_02g383000 [Oryza sativa Japonica Group]|nr:hypothetical protein DAI22_02g383000 [Oryza sativa Japonica Group]
MWVCHWDPHVSDQILLPHNHTNWHNWRAVALAGFWGPEGGEEGQGWSVHPCSSFFHRPKHVKFLEHPAV